MNKPSGESYAVKTMAALAVLVKEKQTAKVREPEVMIEEIAERLFIQTDKQQRSMWSGLSYYTGTGKIIKLRKGVYTMPDKVQQDDSKQLVMWRLLRSRRKVTVTDLREMAAVSRVYASDWLGSLVKRGLVKYINKKYILIKDPGPEMPVDEEKAAKLRETRRLRKKKAIKALDQADKANKEARMAVLAIEIE